MKKLFWITFLIVVIYVFNINVSAKNKNYSYLLDIPEESSFITVEVNLKSKELINIFEKYEKVTITSLLPSDPFCKKNFVTSGYTVKEQFGNVLEKYTDYLIEKGYGELAMKYKVNGFNVRNIKVFGKNKDLYEFMNYLQSA